MNPYMCGFRGHIYPEEQILGGLSRDLETGWLHSEGPVIFIGKLFLVPLRGFPRKFTLINKDYIAT